MKVAASVLSGVVFLLGAFCSASALPGQTFTVVKAEVARKGFAIRCPISDMSGAPFCIVTGQIAAQIHLQL